MKNKDFPGIISTALSGEIMKTFPNRKSQKEKSVRTTFTLTKDGDDALKYLIQDGDRKIKSIIDKLCEVISEPSDGKKESISDIIFEGIKDGGIKNKREVRKTVVLSAKSLSILNTLAKKHSVSRDMILDSSFKTIAFLSKNLIETTLKNHKEILRMVDKLFCDAEEIEKQAKRILNENDPLLDRISSMIVVIMNLSQDLAVEQTKKIPINPEVI